MAKSYLKFFSKDFPEISSKLSYGGQIYSVVDLTDLRHDNKKIIELDSICPICFNHFSFTVMLPYILTHNGFNRRCRKHRTHGKVGGLK